MNLGTFSVSLTVEDMKRSQKFYEDLGFEAFDDHEEDDWVIRFLIDQHDPDYKPTSVQ